MRGVFAALIVTLLIGTTFTTYAKHIEERIEVLQDYLPVEMHVPVTWETCGEWNGAYYPGAQRIVLCEENKYLPLGAQRMIFLHELGHAFTIPRDTPTYRWNGNYEDEADEFAAIMSIVQGHEEDLLVMAQVWENWAKENPPKPGDPHSPAIKRAKVLRDIYWGFQDFGLKHLTYLEALEFWKAQFLKENNGPT